MADAIVKLAEEGPWPLGQGAVDDPANSPPPGALADAADVLFDDSGVPFQRGGSVLKSNADFNSTLRWLWDGYLQGGQRTLFVDATNDDLGALNADDATPATVYSAATIPTPVSAAQLGGVLFMSLGLTGILAYAGARAADYSTGTATATAGSRTVAGVGTTWTTNIEAGTLLTFTGSTRVAVVESIQSNTSLTLTEPWQESTLAGVAYAASKTKVIQAAVATFEHVGVAGGRLWVMAANRLLMSPAGDPFSTAWVTTEEYHDFPGSGLGLRASRDVLMVFTTAGVYAIYGAANDFTDSLGNPQQRVELVAKELVLWGPLGVVEWQGSLIVPALDGMWILDAAQAQRVPGAASDRIASQARSSLYPGKAAVHQGHMFLPRLASVSGDPVTTDVFRLIPTNTGQTFLLSTIPDLGDTGSPSAFAQRSSTTGTAPVLLVGVAARVATCAFFGSTNTDVDGDNVQSNVRGRPLPVAGTRPVYVSHVRVRHSGFDDAVVDVFVDGASIASSGTLAVGTGYVGTTLPVRRSATRIAVSVTGDTSTNAGSQILGWEVFGRPPSRP